MKIATYNVRGIKTETGQDRVMAILKEFDQVSCDGAHPADVVLLQETNVENEHEIVSTSLRAEYNVYVNPSNPGSRTGSGTAILVRKEFQRNNAVEGYLIVPGYLQMLLIPSLRLCLINVYMPQAEHVDGKRERRAIQVMTELISTVVRARECQEELEVMIGGDWNFVLNPEDRSSGNGRREFLAEFLRNLLEKYALCDITAKFPIRSLPTFRDKRNSTTSRLDRFYATSSLADSVETAKLWPPTEGFTDHACVYIKLF